MGFGGFAPGSFGGFWPGSLAGGGRHGSGLGSGFGCGLVGGRGGGGCCTPTTLARIVPSIATMSRPTGSAVAAKLVLINMFKHVTMKLRDRAKFSLRIGVGS